MKRYVISIIIVILVLVAVAGSLVLADKLFYVPDEEVISISETYPIGEIKRIEVDIPVGYVNIFEKTDSENISIDFVGISKDFYTVSFSEVTLEITGNELRWYDRMRLSTEGKYGVTIGIPEELFQYVDINTDTGNITLNDLDVNHIFANANVGSITVSSSTVYGEIIVSVDTGNITLNNINTPAIKAEVDVGNIEFEALNEIVNSNIDAYYNFSCDIGSINGSLPLSRENYTLIATSDVGKVPENFELGPIKLELSVDTGDISVGFGR